MSSATLTEISSYRTRAFREAFAELPAEIQNLAERTFAIFVQNPHHPGLKRLPLRCRAEDAEVGREEVRVGLRYRAIFRRGLLESDSKRPTFVWEWIGPTEAAVQIYRRAKATPNPKKPRHEVVITKPPRPRAVRVRKVQQPHVQKEIVMKENGINQASTNGVAKMAPPPTPAPRFAVEIARVPTALEEIGLHLSKAIGTLKGVNEELDFSKKRLAEEIEFRKKVAADLAQAEQRRRSLEDEVKNRDERVRTLVAENTGLKTELEKARSRPAAASKSPLVRTIFEQAEALEVVLRDIAAMGCEKGRGFECAECRSCKARLTVEAA